MLFSYCCGQQSNRWCQKWRWIAGNFDCHGNAALQRGVYRPVEHIQGFTGSHWMPLLGECLRRITPAATMVNKFVITTQNTTKTQLLASNYGTFRALVNCENFVPQKEPSTQLIDATSCVKMWDGTIGTEGLAVISSYQTLSALSGHEARFISWRIYAPLVVKLLRAMLIFCRCPNFIKKCAVMRRV